MIAKIYENLPTELNECVKCKWALPLSEFRKDKSKKNGLKSWCKRRAHVRTDKTREGERLRYKLNPERAIARNQRRRIKNPDCRQKERFSLYNLSEAEYQILLLKQKSRCAICGISQAEMSRNLSIDHCHATGKVRGLLCGNCNRGIGFLEENISTLENAIKYLRLA